MKGSITPPEARAKISAALKGRKHTTEARQNIALAAQRNSTDIIATRASTTRDLEWAAGFLEGEGNFASPSRVKASQVNPDPLSHLQEIFGGRVVRQTRSNTHGGKWSHYWDWTIYGARARGVMLTLYELMSEIRQDQIKVALQ